MTMTFERLKVINEYARRVKQLEQDLSNCYDGAVTPETRAQIDDLVKRDLEAQLAEAQRQFRAA